MPNGTRIAPFPGLWGAKREGQQAKCWPSAVFRPRGQAPVELLTVPSRLHGLTVGLVTNCVPLVAELVSFTLPRSRKA